jgi:FlaA1/EpsC-like NDP-sugar epimerase
MGVNEFAFYAIKNVASKGPVVRFGTQFAIDAVAWTVALIAAVMLRYDFQPELVGWSSLAAICALTIVIQFVTGWIFYLYRGRHPYGSFAEVLALTFTVLVTGAIVGLPLLLVGALVEVPRSTMIIGLPIAFVLMGAVRYLKRVIVESARRPSGDVERALIYGAGYLGSTIVRRMVTDSNATLSPVGMIDDNPSKRHVRFDGVRVLGARKDLAAAVEATGATVLVVAIAKTDAVFLRDTSDAARALGIQIKVLPPFEEVLEGKSRLKDLRDVSIEDLIGRHPVDTEVESIASYITGRRVLVTGAGGSIGSELCRQIAKFSPAELIMLDRDETGLQGTQLSIFGHGLLDTRDVVLADIRDAETLQTVFQERRPEVVFHAAALKHLPMLEQYPEEAWKTNVLGTLNVLHASLDVDVKTFVNISTDKAANPTSVLGHSKRVAEKLTAWAASQSDGNYLSVRFGNVIGSRGSMLPTFTALIEAGGPLTITHRDVTRFFMTIPEACQLVVQAGAIGQSAEVLILDMGEPVRILDVAERMIEMSGKDISIVFTGLRRGEKLHEELIGRHESDERPIHPKISHAMAAPMSPEELDHDEWLARCRRESTTMEGHTA